MRSTFSANSYPRSKSVGTLTWSMVSLLLIFISSLYSSGDISPNAKQQENNIKTHTKELKRSMDKENKRCMKQNQNNMKSRTTLSETKKYLN